MILEIKAYEVRCDHCEATATVKSGVGFQMPAGWGMIHSRNHGLTGYTKELDLCPDCLLATKLSSPVVD